MPETGDNPTWQLGELVRDADATLHYDLTEAIVAAHKAKAARESLDEAVAHRNEGGLKEKVGTKVSMLSTGWVHVRDGRMSGDAMRDLDEPAGFAGIFSGLAVFDTESIFPDNGSPAELCLVLEPDPDSQHPNVVVATTYIPMSGLVGPIHEFLPAPDSTA